MWNRESLFGVLLFLAGFFWLTARGAEIEGVQGRAVRTVVSTSGWHTAASGDIVVGTYSDYLQCKHDFEEWAKHYRCYIHYNPSTELYELHVIE
jgi:hypothetical protein